MPNNRNLPLVPRLIASAADARAALEGVVAAGHFPVAGPDGQTRQVTLEQISDWRNANYAAKGEPPLEPEELDEVLIHDFIFGRLRVRTDGLWESDNGYLTGGVKA